MQKQLWAGRVLSSFAVLFLLFDSAGKLFQVQPVIDGTFELGYPRDQFPHSILVIVDGLVRLDEFPEHRAYFFRTAFDETPKFFKEVVRPVMLVDVRSGA